MRPDDSRRFRTKKSREVRWVGGGGGVGMGEANGAGECGECRKI